MFHHARQVSDSGNFWSSFIMWFYGSLFFTDTAAVSVSDMCRSRIRWLSALCTALVHCGTGSVVCTVLCQGTSSTVCLWCEWFTHGEWWVWWMVTPCHSQSLIKAHSRVVNSTSTVVERYSLSWCSLLVPPYHGTGKD